MACTPSPSQGTGGDTSDVRKQIAVVSLKELGKQLSTSGVAVSIATSVTHPLDVVKVKLQVEYVGQRTTSSGMVKKVLFIIQQQGFYPLYSGLAPALLRSAVYGCLRLGLYEPSKTILDYAFDQTNLLTKLVAGAISGSVATAATNPLDVLKIRLQARDVPVPLGLMKELHQLARSEGLFGLWKGVCPAMARASTLTASQLVAYDESKQLIKRQGVLKEGFWLHFSASVMAGLIGTAATAPMDTLKTRLMMQADGKDTYYRNTFDCGYKILKREGLPGLYKGWSALFARLGPQTAITFVVYEKMRKLAGMDAV